MTLSKSFNSKLYRWFYCTNELPNNLCTYFWGLVISYLFLIPIGLLTLPITICRFNNLRQSNYEFDSFIDRLGISTTLWVLIYLLFCLISPITLFFTSYTQDSLMYYNIQLGLSIWGILIVVIVFVSIDIVNKNRRLYSRRGNKKVIENKPNLIIEFIKAKYNNYCPKIDWVNDDKKPL